MTLCFLKSTSICSIFHVSVYLTKDGSVCKTCRVMDLMKSFKTVAHCSFRYTNLFFKTVYFGNGGMVMHR